MNFGEKLKKLRFDNNLTQDEIAEKIYVTRTAISKWETDKGYPSIDSLKQLSNLFRISIDELISDTGLFWTTLFINKLRNRWYNEICKSEFVKIIVLSLELKCWFMRFA